MADAIGVRDSTELDAMGGLTQYADSAATTYRDHLSAAMGVVGTGTSVEYPMDELLLSRLTRRIGRSRPRRSTIETFVTSLEQRGAMTPVADLGDFAALDTLRTPLGRIRRIINELRFGSTLDCAEQLARRLEFLVEAMEEEGESWREGSPESLRKMLQFLRAEPGLGMATVTVTPAATFRAQWTAGESQHLAVEFLPNGEARFVIFAPNPRHPGRVQRVSGMTSWENLANVMSPYNVYRWAANARAKNSCY